MEETKQFLTGLSHTILKKLTRSLNLHTSIKSYTKLSKDELVNKLAEKTRYTNGKLTISIPISDLDLPVKTPRKPRTKKVKEPEEVTPKQEIPSEEAVIPKEEIQPEDEITIALARFITDMTKKDVINQSLKLEDKMISISDAIKDIENIQFDNNISVDEKKQEILNTLELVQNDMPEIDTQALTNEDKVINDNLDDNLKKYTKALFESFYADDMAELDALGFNFDNTTYKEFDNIEISNKPTNNIVTADINEDTGMISIELIEATKNIKRQNEIKQNMFIPIPEEKNTIKSYIDELNDELSELDTLSFNYGQNEIKTLSPIKIASPPQERIPSPPMIQENPKEKRQIPMQMESKKIDNPGQWISDNLQVSKKFKSPNERHRWNYYDKTEINSVNDLGVLEYLKDDANTFKGVSKEHPKQTLIYITSQYNNVLKRMEQLIKNRNPGRPTLDKSDVYKEQKRRENIMMIFESLPLNYKNKFYKTISEIDKIVIQKLRDYARDEAFDNNYILFDETTWEESKLYSDITDLYYFDNTLDTILVKNKINKSYLSNFIDLHIENENFLSQLNRFIIKEEQIYKRDPKILSKQATKIQSAVRGFLTRKRLERNPPKKSDILVEREANINAKYDSIIKTGGIPNYETLKEYFDTNPKANMNSIIKDIKKGFEDNNISKKIQNSLLKKLDKFVTMLKSETEGNLYRIEFERKDFDYWRNLILKQPYADKGLQARLYNLKKLYKSAVDEGNDDKQIQILLLFSNTFNEQKVKRLIDNLFIYTA